MKYLFLVSIALALMGHVNAALLPGPESGNPKPLPSAGDQDKVLPGAGSAQLPVNSTPGRKVLPVPATASGGGDFLSGATSLRLVDLVASDRSDNSRATLEAGEPIHGGYSGNPGGKSMWWRFESRINGVLFISTQGSNFDTTLGVYFGETVSGLFTLASDNNSGPNETSAVSLPVSAGSVYYIAVDGYNGASGKIVLNLVGVPVPSVNTGRPVNDDYVNRRQLVGSYTTDFGNNYNATSEPEDFPSIIISESSAQTVWWTWTAPSTGRVTILTAGSDFDTMLNVFNRTSGSYLFNDDVSRTDRSSIISTTVTAGDVLDISVEGWALSTGFITLSVDLQPLRPLPSNDIFDFRRGIQEMSYSLNTTTTNTVSNEIDEPAHAASSASNSLWWTWTAPANGVVTVNAIATPATGTATPNRFKPVIAVYRGPRLSFLKHVTSAQDSDLDGDAQSVFSVTKGEIYQIAVAAIPGQGTGAFTFRLGYENGTPVISAQPEDLEVDDGGEAQFSVSLRKNTLQPVRYQWQRLGAKGKWTDLSDSATYSGARTSTLTVSPVTLTMDGSRFRCVISNASGQITSKSATLTVNQPAAKSPLKKSKKSSGGLLGG